MDLALNNLQWLICHKTKLKQYLIIALKEKENSVLRPSKFRLKTNFASHLACW